MRRFLAALALAVLIGAVAGLFVPRGAQGYVINVSLRVNRGASNTLTCGWHSSFCPSNRGSVALDWDNGDNATVYWRSWGWCSQSCNNIATGAISLAVPFCTETRVTITDQFGRGQGSMIYTHTGTSQSGSTFYIKGLKDTWKDTPPVGIGYSLTQENGGCNTPDFGSHLHLYHSGSGWTKNSLYPSPPPPPGTASYSVTLLGNYQCRRGWTFSF